MPSEATGTVRGVRLALMLGCGHSRRTFLNRSAVPGDRAFCSECQGVRRVTAVFPADLLPGMARWLQ